MVSQKSFGLFCDGCCGPNGSRDGIVEVALAIADDEPKGKPWTATSASAADGDGPMDPKVTVAKAASNGLIQATDGGFSRRVKLTEKGRRYIAATFAAGGPESPMNPEAISDASLLAPDDWSIYFDTSELTLIRRDAWLRKRANTWELRVRLPQEAALLLAKDPPLVLKPPNADTRYEVISGAVGIAAYIDQAMQAVVAKDPSAAFESVLASFGVRPFARWHSEHRLFGADSSLGSSAKLVIDVELVHFDTTYAEPATVSMMLTNDGMREALFSAFADCRIESARQEASSDLEDFLAKHGLDTDGGGSLPGSSAVLEYMTKCRPAHLHMLEKADVLLDADKAGFAGP